MGAVGTVLNLISNIQHQHPKSREDSNLKVQLTKKRRETFWSLDLDVSLDLGSWMLNVGWLSLEFMVTTRQIAPA